MWVTKNRDKTRILFRRGYDLRFRIEKKLPVRPIRLHKKNPNVQLLGFVYCCIRFYSSFFHWPSPVSRHNIIIISKFYISLLIPFLPHLYKYPLPLYLSLTLTYSIIWILWSPFTILHTFCNQLINNVDIRIFCWNRAISISHLINYWFSSIISWSYT